MEQALLCPGCGLPRDETMLKERQLSYAAHPQRCHACRARARAAEKFNKEGSTLAGLFFRIEQVD